MQSLLFSDTRCLELLNLTTLYLTTTLFQPSTLASLKSQALKTLFMINKTTLLITPSTEGASPKKVVSERTPFLTCLLAPTPLLIARQITTTPRCKTYFSQLTTSSRNSSLDPIATSFLEKNLKSSEILTTQCLTSLTDSPLLARKKTGSLAINRSNNCCSSYLRRTMMRTREDIASSFPTVHSYPLQQPADSVSIESAKCRCLSQELTKAELE